MSSDERNPQLSDPYLFPHRPQNTNAGLQEDLNTQRLIVEQQRIFDQIAARNEEQGARAQQLADASAENATLLPLTREPQGSGEPERTEDFRTRCYNTLTFFIIMMIPSAMMFLLFSTFQVQQQFDCLTNPRYGDATMYTYELESDISTIFISGPGSLYLRANNTDRIHVQLFRQSMAPNLLNQRVAVIVQRTGSVLRVEHDPFGGRGAWYNTTQCFVVEKVVTVPFSLLNRTVALSVRVAGQHYRGAPENVFVFSDKALSQISPYQREEETADPPIVSQKPQFFKLDICNENGGVKLASVLVQQLNVSCSADTVELVDVAVVDKVDIGVESDVFMQYVDMGVPVHGSNNGTIVVRSSGSMFRNVAHAKSIQAVAHSSPIYFEFDSTKWGPGGEFEGEFDFESPRAIQLSVPGTGLTTVFHNATHWSGTVGARHGKSNWMRIEARTSGSSSGIGLEQKPAK